MSGEDKRLTVLANKIDNAWAAVDKMTKGMEALVATINADRAERFSDRVTQWKIEASLNFILQKQGSKLPLPEGAPEGTPQKIVSWYEQFMPKWQKFMADFQISTSEGVIPDEKITPSADKPEDTQASPAPIVPLAPEDLARADAAGHPGNGGTVQFPGSSPSRPEGSPEAGSQAGGETN